MVDLWKKLSGELIDIIEWLDDSNNTLVYRFERMNNEIRVRCQAHRARRPDGGVHQRGPAGDVFKPGMHADHAEPAHPVHAEGWKYGFESPFKAEVYFVSTRKFTDLKWGTPGPATMRDKEFGIVRATAFGIYTIRVKDPGIFIKDISGTEGRFTTEQIQENLRGKMAAHQGSDARIGLSIIDPRPRCR